MVFARISSLTLTFALLFSPALSLACPETSYTLSNGQAEIVLTEKQCSASVDYYLSGPGGTAYLGSAGATIFDNEPSGVIPPGYNQVVWNDIESQSGTIARWGLASSGSGFYGVLTVFRDNQVQGVFTGGQ